MSTARPYFNASIADLEAECEGDLNLIDAETKQAVRGELAFRRGSKRVRKLAKALGAQWKLSPTNAAQVAQADTAQPFPVADLGTVESEVL